VKMRCKQEPQPALGGPGSLLPWPLESFLSWSLCISCLSISGYHYCVAAFIRPAWNRWRMSTKSVLAIVLGIHNRKRLQHSGSDTIKQSSDSEKKALPFERAWVPLTTCSRSEQDRFTAIARLQQLDAALARLLNPTQLEVCKDKELVNAIRSDEICRRLASLAMKPYRKIRTTEPGGAKYALANETLSFTTLLDDFPHLDLPRRLARVWPELLTLPSVLALKAVTREDQPCYCFEISLIVPAFREDGSDVSQKLSHALQSCMNPERVDLLIIDAGGCTGLNEAFRQQLLQSKTASSSSKSVKRWGKVQCFKFTAGGGRGPCLNFGAKRAVGKVLSFCHSDTALPMHWDAGILNTLFPTGNRLNDGGKRPPSACRVNMCAFRFGIDTTSIGLKGGHFPPGIRAVETTANLRTQLYSLPYGDQCLSVPSEIFHYVGGFPDQCLFEDYELVALLRKRSALLPMLGLDREKESVGIIDGPPALCSPRRWQKCGVLYVTYMNSKLVNLYTGGMSPDDIFCMYYGGDPPRRETEESPWEKYAADQGFIENVTT